MIRVDGIEINGRIIHPLEMFVECMIPVIKLIDPPVIDRAKAVSSDEY